jgi:PKD domain-containing protein
MPATVTRGLVVAIAWLGFTAGPVHAAGWGPLQPIGTGDGAQLARLAADLTPAGAATIVWPGTFEGNRAMLATTRAPGGAFTPRAVLADNHPAALDRPALAVAPDGLAVAAWGEKDGAGVWSLLVAVRSPAGTWSAAETLMSGGSEPPDPDVAIGDDGTAMVIWAMLEPVFHGHVHVSRRARGGAWSAPEPVSFSESTDPQVVIDRHGDATVLWIWEFSDLIASKRRSAAGTWSSFDDLGEAGASSPHLAVGADGTVGAIWERSSDVEAAIRPPGGPWGEPELAGGPAGSYPYERPQIALDGAGTATAVLPGFLGLRTNRRPAGGAWAAETQILVPREKYQWFYWPAVVANSRGFTATGYRGETDPLSTGDVDGVANAGAAVRAPGGGWGAALDIGEPGGVVGLDVDERDHVLTSWLTHTGVLYARVYDPVGPRLSGLSIPARGRAERPVPFAVTARDDWSALGTTTWDFGDGRTASGNRVAHVYVRAGRYTVRVTARDALGNATTTQRVVVVDPAPPRLRLDVARFVRAGFARSHVTRRARVLVEGAITEPLRVSLELTGPLRPSGGRESVALGALQLTAGAVSERLRVPKALVPKLLPGSYELRVQGPELVPVTKRFELRAPREGVVMAHRISTSRSGPNLLRVSRATELWATFTFARGGGTTQPLRARWYAPNRSKPVGSFPIKQFSFWRNPRGLAKGRWRCVLVARGRVVESVSIRVG